MDINFADIRQGYADIDAYNKLRKKSTKDLTILGDSISRERQRIMYFSFFEGILYAVFGGDHDRKLTAYEKAIEKIVAERTELESNLEERSTIH